MPVPIIAGMTALEVASATVGTVAAVPAMLPSGESGFLFNAGEATYPTEQNDNFGQFVTNDHYINRVAMRFLANGYIWDTDIDIAMRGYFSQDSGELMTFADDDVAVPANRFMKDVGFYTAVGSDRISSSLLKVAIDPDVSVAGTPDHPHLIWQVTGRFDPVGFGDSDFFFRLFVDTWGQVSVDNINAPGMSVTYDAQAVHITLDQ